MLLGLDQRQRVDMPRADLTQGAEAITEHALQLFQKTAVVQLGKTLSVVARTRPDQRTAIVRQWQQGHRPVVGETFERLPAMRLARRDVGDQRALIVRPLPHTDTQLLAQAGTTAIGEHGQIAFQLGFITEGQAITIGQRLHLPDLGRHAPTDYVSVQPRPERLTKPGVFHDIAQRRNALFDCRQAGRAEAAAVRYLNLQNGLGTSGDLLPEAQTFVDAPCAERQR
ncbi:hypothetical protein ALP75_203787 [Pseudomonas syringae pv. actinidiae]|nr:hypothetical protein ALP75_203787 [Pseudomonas syringae pv. actinidiae]